MPVNVTTNSPSQDYTHLDDYILPTYDMTPGYKTIYQGNVWLLSIRYNYVGILSIGPKTNAIIIVLVKI